MNEIKVTGKQKISSFEFISIEGGFGVGNKAMTLKDIAEIHGQPLREINRRVNDNIHRFKNGVDIIDLKLGGFEPLTYEDFGFSKQSAANSNNIYIASERGYAKLLKILEDDTAWEIYDELVDGYFSMRESKPKKQRPKGLNVVLRKNVTTAKYMEELGVSKGIASAKAIELTEQETGEDLSAWKVLLPYKGDNELTYNPTGIGKMIGCKPTEVNTRLIDCGLQVRSGDGKYEVTEKGEEYSELLPFAKNGHSSYQIKWKKSVIEVIG